MKWEEPKLVDLADRLKSFGGGCSSGTGQQLILVCGTGIGDGNGCLAGTDRVG